MRKDERVNVDDNPLEQAREYLLEHGWCRNTLENGQGEVCLIGSLHRVMAQFSFEELIRNRSAIAALDSACRELFPEVTGNKTILYPTHWIAKVNDRVIRSKDEAAEVLERAAKLWERDHQPGKVTR